MKKLCDKLFLICIAVFLLAVLGGTWRKRGEETSFYENRALAAMPALTGEGLASGEYAAGLEDFLTDRAFARSAALRAGVRARLLLLRQPVVNGVVDTGALLLRFHGYQSFGAGDVPERAGQRAAELGALSEYVSGLGLRVLSGDELVLRRLEQPFLGSRSRELYGLETMGERLTIGELRDPIPFTRTDNGLDSAPAVYALPGPGEAATYSVYMGGDIAETVISTNRPELPDALIFGDSFTNALETVLYAAFDETRSLDLRYYTGMSLRDYIAEHSPEVIICLRGDTDLLSPEGNGAIWP